MSSGTSSVRRALVALMRRESRGARGRLFFMTACLALGVAAVTGVAALVASVDAAVSRCLLYTSPSPRDRTRSRMPSSA